MKHMKNTKKPGRYTSSVCSYFTAATLAIASSEVAQPNS